MQVEIKGLEELERAFLRAPEITARHLNTAIKRTLAMYEREATKNTPVDTGYLRNRRTSIIGNLQGGLIFGAKYAAAIHEGTKPHWPPKNILEVWARRHGAKNPKSAAFLIGRKIARKGTSARPFLRNAVNYLEKEKDRNFNKALEDITKEMAKQ